jgi:hypothetical protein
MIFVWAKLKQIIKKKISILKFLGKKITNLKCSMDLTNTLKNLRWIKKNQLNCLLVTSIFLIRRLRVQSSLMKQFQKRVIIVVINLIKYLIQSIFSLLILQHYVYWRTFEILKVQGLTSQHMQYSTALHALCELVGRLHI